VNIALLEMPAERVFKVQVEGNVIPGYINRELESDDSEWFWTESERSERTWLSKEAAALSLAARWFEEQARHREMQSVTQTKEVHEEVRVWQCRRCRREVARHVSSPPGTCQCGAPTREWGRVERLEDGYTTIVWEV